jgi:hypothetical protein
MRRNNGKGKAMYGISRIDDDVYRTHAWRVSLCRRGARHVKNFADKKLGGKGRALKSAKQYRDTLLRKHPPLSRKEFCSTLRSNNKSGITGVYTYAKSFTLRDGTIKESRYWEAHWPTEEGEHAHQSFPVNEYGEETARELAIRARKRAMRRLDGVFWASGRGVVEPSVL